MGDQTISVEDGKLNWRRFFRVGYKGRDNGKHQWMDRHNGCSQNGPRSVTSSTSLSCVVMCTVSVSEKHCSDSSDVLSDEVEIMKKIGRHHNVIALIGVCLLNGLHILSSGFYFRQCIGDFVVRATVGCDGIRRGRRSPQLPQITEVCRNTRLTHTQILCHKRRRKSAQ